MNKNNALHGLFYRAKGLKFGGLALSSGNHWSDEPWKIIMKRRLLLLRI